MNLNYSAPTVSIMCSPVFAAVIFPLIYRLDSEKNCENVVMKHLDLGQLYYHIHPTTKACSADVIFDTKPYHSPDFIHRKLLKEELILVCRADHPRIGSMVNAEEFCNEVHAVFSSYLAGSSECEQQLQQRFPNRKIGYVGSSYAGLFSVIENTEIISMVPMLILTCLQKAFNIKPVMYSFEPGIKTQDIYMSWRHDLKDREGLTAFNQILQKIR